MRVGGVAVGAAERDLVVAAVEVRIAYRGDDRRLLRLELADEPLQRAEVGEVAELRLEELADPRRGDLLAGDNRLDRVGDRLARGEPA